MSGLLEINNSFLWYIITLTSLALVLGGLIAVIHRRRANRDLRVIMAASFYFAASLILFVTLMDCARYDFQLAHGFSYPSFQNMIFHLPWGVYALLETLLAAALFLILREDIRYRTNHLTPDAIRETVNLLPEGICIYAKDGTVLLSNLRMNSLCRMLTGSPLSNAVTFRQQIENSAEKNNDEYLIQTQDGKTWRFFTKQILSEGKRFDQLTASDITEQYRVTEELREKNARLKEIQKRMKEVSDLSGDMFIAQEKASARAALHNQLGQVLLTGRHFLEHPESTDASMVRTATKEMNLFLLREAENAEKTTPEPFVSENDPLQQAVTMARSIGVKTDLQGIPPEDPSRRDLLSLAIQECAANAVKHAEGNQIHVVTDENGFSVTNNGKPPKGPVIESGGLLSLRRSAEEANGRMVVESEPAFKLTVRY